MSKESLIGKCLDICKHDESVHELDGCHYPYCPCKNKPYEGRDRYKVYPDIPINQPSEDKLDKLYLDWRKDYRVSPHIGDEVLLTRLKTYVAQREQQARREFADKLKAKSIYLFEDSEVCYVNQFTIDRILAEINKDNK